MNKHQREIDALASSIVIHAVDAFTETFPNDTDENFEFFYACIAKQIINTLFRWRMEDTDTEANEY